MQSNTRILLCFEIVYLMAIEQLHSVFRIGVLLNKTYSFVKLIHYSLSSFQTSTIVPASHVNMVARVLTTSTSTHALVPQDTREQFVRRVNDT